MKPYDAVIEELNLILAHIKHEEMDLIRTKCNAGEVSEEVQGRHSGLNSAFQFILRRYCHWVNEKKEAEPEWYDDLLKRNRESSEKLTEIMGIWV